MPTGVDEDAVVVLGQVPQVVGVAAEVVAHAHLEVITNVAVDGGERAEIGGLTRVLPQGAAFQQNIPVLHHMDVRPDNGKLRGGTFPVAAAAGLRLAQAHAIFAAKRQHLRHVIGRHRR